MFGRKIAVRLDRIRPGQDENVREISTKKGRETSFSVGEHVMIRDYAVNTKSWAKARIVKVLGPRIYLCKFESSKVTCKRHVNQIMACGNHVDRDQVNASNTNDREIRTIKPQRPKTTAEALLSSAPTVVEVNNNNSNVNSRPRRQIRTPVRLDL